VTDRLYVRQVSDSHWQWRLRYASGEWDEDIYAGTIELLAESLPHANLPVCVLVPGCEAVVRQMSVDTIEKKHLVKLLPFEMEEQLIDPVEDMHFCFGDIENDTVNVIYLNSEQMEKTLEAFAPTACEVQQVFPDYLLLRQEQYVSIIVLDGEQVIARFRDSKGFAIEINVAPLVLQSLQNALVLDDESGAALLLVASSENDVAVLHSCLPDAWLNNENLEIHQRVATYWDCIDPELVATSLNMRCGAFARQLPISRWWQMWKTPGYWLAASFILALMVNMGGYVVAKAEGKEIRKQIERVYLQAVPKGRRGDEENRLKSLLKKGGDKKAKPGNLMVLLSGLAKTMAAQEDIQLSTFRYNGEQHELQINIEVKGLGELGQFRELLATNGLLSGSPRTTHQGDVYRADMKISEAN